MIAATIISNNQEKLVADAVRSVLGWVDRLVLIDTGITDDTTRIVESLAGERLVAEPFEWKNDFSAARNFALNAAAKQGATWALTLDTDERLSFPGFSSLDELRKALDSNPAIQAWFVFSKDGTYSKERFIRVATDERPRLVWKGRTHEYLAGAKHGERATLNGVTVAEVRKTPEAFRAKLLRDLEILQQETAAKPNESRWWFYLGQTYEGLRQFSDAIDAFRRCAANHAGWAEQAAWACYRTASCCLQLGQRVEALELCGLGLARQPESPELAWLAGYICYRLGKMREAVTWSQLSVTLGSFRGHDSGRHRISFRYLPAWYEGPYDVLRFAYRQLGQTSLADECETAFSEAKRKRESLYRSAGAEATEPALDAHDSNSPKSTRIPTTDHPLANSIEHATATKRHRPTRVAVLGLFSSGSSATASVLRELGVFMGRDLFMEYCEPRWLAAQLRKWWNEPSLTEATPYPERVQFLARWINDLERGEAAFIGAKHPLLTLSAFDLLEAWGDDTKFIWSWRPIDESIQSLERRGWWPGREPLIQQQLWSAAEKFFSAHAHLQVRFQDMLHTPEREIDRLVEFLALKPTPTQRRSALAAVRRP